MLQNISSKIQPTASAFLKVFAKRTIQTCSHAVYKQAGLAVQFETNLPMPEIVQPTDAIVKVIKTTICGTDLHILNGNVSSCAPGRRLGHEGIGEIVEVGSAVTDRKVGERVLMTTTTACGHCSNCQNKFYGHCEDGGWILGNRIDGLQGTHTRVPHVDSSSYVIPEHLWGTPQEDDIVMCSDILPTGLEVGLLDGDIKPGMSIAIVGAGPVGLAAQLCASMYPPKDMFMIDMNEHRLQTSKEIMETPGLENTNYYSINNKDNTAVDQVMEATKGHGVDLVVEAIGIPQGWYMCQDMVRAGGHIAMLGVHGKPATINLERMWYKNFKMSAGLVHGYSTPMLIERILNGKLPARKLISHRLPMSQMEKAYHMFTNAGKYETLKILLENDMA